MPDNERHTSSRKKRTSGANDASDYAESDDSDYPPPPKKRARASTAKAKAFDVGGDATTAEARALVASILKAPTSFTLPMNEDPRHHLLLLAKYAHSLELSNAAAAGTVGTVPVKKSPEQLIAAAEKLRKACKSQIKKQMTWKPSCKTGGAKWTYDGIAPDAVAIDIFSETFASLLHETEPIKWKAKKMTPEDFQAALGDHFIASARYSRMFITSNINVKWNPSTGQFKFSGYYGIPRSTGL